MTRTKETARKPLCPICRGYTKSKDFIAHVRNCQESHSCSICDKIFKKSSYLKKHMSRVHAEVKTSTGGIQFDETKNTPEPLTKNKPLGTNPAEKTSTSTCALKDESFDSEYDFTDFAPDIEIGEDTDESLELQDESENETSEKLEEKKPEREKPELIILDDKASEVRSKDQEENNVSKENEPKGDNRVVQDIRTGRIFRKQTRQSSVLTSKMKADQSIKNDHSKRMKTTETQTEEMSNVSLRSIDTQTEDTKIAREQRKNKAKDKSEFKNECCYCQIYFKDSVLLNLHMGIHTMNDPFKCNRCGLSTSGRFELYSHIMWGHGN